MNSSKPVIFGKKSEIEKYDLAIKSVHDFDTSYTPWPSIGVFSRYGNLPEPYALSELLTAMAFTLPYNLAASKTLTVPVIFVSNANLGLGNIYMKKKDYRNGYNYINKATGLIKFTDEGVKIIK